MQIQKQSKSKEDPEIQIQEQFFTMLQSFSPGLDPLVLHNCKNVPEILQNLTQPGVKMQLRKFEVVYVPLFHSADISPALAAFLKTFEGLQELYVGHTSSRGQYPESSGAILNHTATLRRLVWCQNWYILPEKDRQID